MNRAYIEKTYLFHECQYEEKIVDSEDNYDEYGNSVDEYVNQEYREPETIKCFKVTGHRMSINSGTINSTFGSTYYLVCDERVKQGDRIDGQIVNEVIAVPVGFNNKDRLYQVTFKG